MDPTDESTSVCRYEALIVATSSCFAILPIHLLMQLAAKVSVAVCLRLPRLYRNVLDEAIRNRMTIGNWGMAQSLLIPMNQIYRGQKDNVVWVAQGRATPRQFRMAR